MRFSRALAQLMCLVGSLLHDAADDPTGWLPETAQLKRDLMEVSQDPVVLRLFSDTTPKDEDEEHQLKVDCKSTMIALLNVNTAEMDALQQRVAFHCAYHAGNSGVWEHHQQWGTVYNPELRGMPIYPRPLRWWPELEAAIAGLERHMPAITAEHFAEKHRGTPNEKYLTLKGKWTGVKLVRASRPPGITCWPRYPNTCEALKQFILELPRCSPGQDCIDLPAPWHEAYTIADATVNVLDPGTSLIRHTSSDNQRIKLHCGISNPSNVSMKIGNQTLVWEPRVCQLIDDSFEHSVTSSDDAETRVILELKIVHPDFKSSSQFLWFNHSKSKEKLARSGKAVRPAVIQLRNKDTVGCDARSKL